MTDPHDPIDRTCSGRKPGAGALGPESEDGLSVGGRARMDAMLPALQLSVVRQGRRRRVRRYVGRSVAVAAIFGIAAFAWIGNDALLMSPALTDVERPHVKVVSAPCIISILESNPGAVRRLAVQRDVHMDDYRVDDRELVTLLNAIGRPAGLVRVRGEIRLTRGVTDTELAFNAARDAPAVGESPAASPPHPAIPQRG